MALYQTSIGKYQESKVFQQNITVIEQGLAVHQQESAVIQQELAVIQQGLAVIQQESTVVEQGLAVIQQESTVIQQLQNIHGALQHDRGDLMRHHWDATERCLY